MSNSRFFSSIFLSNSKSTSAKLMSSKVFPAFFSFISSILATTSGVLLASIPPFHLLATGSKSWLTFSDRLSFCPPPAEATGLDGGAVPMSTDQPLWSLKRMYMGATDRLWVILMALVLSSWPHSFPTINVFRIMDMCPFICVSLLVTNPRLTSVSFTVCFFPASWYSSMVMTAKRELLSVCTITSSPCLTLICRLLRPLFSCWVRLSSSTPSSS